MRADTQPTEESFDAASPTDRPGGVRRVDADGRSVAYATYGSPEGTPLLLFHGTPGSRLLGDLYDRHARERDLRVLVPDRPGYGRSPRWADRTFADAGAIASAVLDDAGVSRAGVVGFSGGGPHALAAATAEDRIAAVDLVSTAAPPELREGTPRAQRWLGVLARGAPLALRGLLRVQAWLADGRPSMVLSQLTDDPSAIPDHEAGIVAGDFVEGIGASRHGLVAETRLLESAWELPVDDLETSVTLWHGTADENAPLAGAQGLANRLPEATLHTVDDGDHLTTLLDSRESVLDRQRSALAD